MNKILVIEDNEEIRENIVEILELTNYKVFTAANGKLGVEKAVEQRPDLIICDIMMPVLDGYGVLHMVHKIPEIQNTPFIFLTAKSERSDFRKGMELGADDYITKPFNGTELLNAVEGRLKKAELLRKELSAGLAGFDQLTRAAGGKPDLKSLTDNRNTNRYRKKQVIYSESNHPSYLYYIQKGKVKTYKSNDDGKELVVGLYRENDFFGYTALLEGTVYKETAEVMEESEIALIPRREFEDLINSSREVSQTFIRLLAKNISEKEQHLLGLAYNSLRKKVAECLLTLVDKYQTGGTDNFVIDISRENLATIAGTATESLIRTLSDFKNEKLIDIKDGNIVILNRKKLSGLLN